MRGMLMQSAIWRIILALAVTLTPSAKAGVALQSYDLQRDFSVASNPNGV